MCDSTSNRFVLKATVFPSKGSSGFVGYGDADPSNVSSLVHGAEMRVAETRAVNRALRKAYGIGICSVEEIGTVPNTHEKIPPQNANSNGNGGSPKVRDRLCQIIRQHKLDPELVKAYAVDFCGTKTLREASREQVENFVQQLGDWAEKDRNALLCQLNSYPRPAQEVVSMKRQVPGLSRNRSRFSSRDDSRRSIPRRRRWRPVPQMARPQTLLHPPDCQFSESAGPFHVIPSSVVSTAPRKRCGSSAGSCAISSMTPNFSPTNESMRRLYLGLRRRGQDQPYRDERYFASSTSTALPRPRQWAELSLSGPISTAFSSTGGGFRPDDLFLHTSPANTSRAHAAIGTTTLDGWQEAGKILRAAMLFGRAFEQAISALFRREDPAAVLFERVVCLCKDTGLSNTLGNRDSWDRMLQQGIR